MVKIALLADLHLPFLETACQYRVMDFALQSIQRYCPDAVVCLGDITASGEVNAADIFAKRMKEIKQPKLVVLGNSDIRTQESMAQMRELETVKEFSVEGIHIIGLDSSDCTLHAQDEVLLASATENTLVCMHHPPERVRCTKKNHAKEYIEEKNVLACVYAHVHYQKQEGNCYSIQALDPDKAKGTPPCVTYLIVEDNEIHLEYDYFPCERPEALEDYIGLSCFDVSQDIDFAMGQNVKNIELRPSAIDYDRDELRKKIKEWRESGGRYLSLHMPNFRYDDRLTGTDEWEQAVRLANDLQVDGVTVHVPRVSVGKMNGTIKTELLDFVVNMIGKLPGKCAVGIENLHMGRNDKDDEKRGFGFVPEECLDFVKDINDRFGHKRVGILLDVGHARNNPPFSQKYTNSVWYEMVGEQIVAYHIHQVVAVGDELKNHTAITDIYGPSISYCSFADCWNRGIINRRPVFLEIRGGTEQYLLSLETLKQWENNSVRRK